jgi:hypothetical protein
MSTRAASVRKCKGNTKVTVPKQPSKTRGGHAKKTLDEDEVVDTPDLKASSPRVLWNLQRTDRLVEWLENNVEDRQRLFSDSAQDAKEENRRRRTAKSVKTSFHIKMADYIFSADEDVRVRDDLKAHGAKRYAKAVENRVTR